MYQQVQMQPMYQPQPVMMQPQPMMMQPQPVIMQQQPVVMMQQQPVIVQQPIMMMQQPVQNMGNPFSFMNAFDKLKNVFGIYVKQKPQFMEALTGCEIQNVYKVFATDSQGEKKKICLFKCKEKSGCLERQCLSADQRPFEMLVNHENKDGQGNDDLPAFYFEREYQCTCLCFNRPELTVFHNEGGKKSLLGKVRNPYTCCNLEMEIYDERNEKIYVITGSICQLGIQCSEFPCESCQLVEFELRNAHGVKIGTFEKRRQSCLSAVLELGNNFSMVFPGDATPQHRALLLASLILLDFTYFEEKGRKGDADIEVDF